MSKQKTETRCRSCLQAEIDIEELEAENKRLWLFVAGRECECGYEYGKQKGEKCARCRLMETAKVCANEQRDV